MKIQLFEPEFRVEETLSEIRECLDLGWSGLGFKTTEFETAWCKYSGHLHSHFVNSNTAGLHIALSVLKAENHWADGDEILTTPLTFVSTNHAILYNNLTPAFCDVDASLNLSPESVRANISTKTRALIFVGMGGNNRNLDEILEICEAMGIKVILDAAHMAGSRYNGSHVGIDPRIECSVYSFQAVKNLPTGDSGMICFKSSEFDRLARQISWLGIDKDTYARTNSEGAYKWRYSVEHLGFKYNGNAIMAAMGLVALRYLDRDNSYRRQLALWYKQELEDFPYIDLITHANLNETSQHLIQIRVKNRDEVVMALNNYQVYPGVHYELSTKHPVYKKFKADTPTADIVSSEILSLPCHMKIGYDHVKKICGSLKNILKR